MGRNYQGKHQGYTENRYQVLAEDRQSRYFVPNCAFLRGLRLHFHCPGVAIMGMEEADVTTTTSMTIGMGMGVQPTVGAGLAIGFGAGEAQSTIGLDHGR